MKIALDLVGGFIIETFPESTFVPDIDLKKSIVKIDTFMS